MSEFTVDDLVNFAVQNDAVNLARALDDVMANKIDSAIENRREEVGASLFGGEDLENDESDDITDDDYSNDENLEDTEEEEPDETDE